MARHTTRRTFAKGIGGAIAAVTLPMAAAGSEEDWTVAETPVDATLHDVVEADDGLYAVGDTGVVLARTGEGWQTVVTGGPTGNGNDLYGADVTDDGERVWFVGASGAIGEYDLETGMLVDHSTPNDVSNNFNDIAVTGTAGEAAVYVAGDSGAVYYSFENGETGSWDNVTPGSGSNINAIDFHGPRSGHAIDGNQTVFVTDDGVTSNKLGIEDADYNFYGLDSNAPGDVWVSGGGGSVYHWNGSEWTRDSTGDASLRDVTVGGGGLTVGDGGAVFERSAGRWTATETPVGQNLSALARGSVDAAVGASGIVLER
ncbi:WD40/YVTN/BNR-like repeat-containing protein [Halovenus salina]|uniref:WD40/YVTN/BNR-like repeat-containing protein n=1 Tax=Halovenus salina TaxID=1510225 RepID=A0ABD5W233_9EURY|nr:hypothetical protein [Halovenus salina]